MDDHLMNISSIAASTRSPARPPVVQAHGTTWHDKEEPERSRILPMCSEMNLP